MNLVIARKGAVIDLEKLASVVCDESGFASINGHTKSVTIHLVGSPPVVVTENDENYTRWLDWLSSKQPLKTGVEAGRERIISDAFNPFIDDEKLTVIYSLFNDIPTHSELLLCLESEEVGAIRYKADLSIAV